MKQFVQCAIGLVVLLAGIGSVANSNFSLFGDSDTIQNQWPSMGQNLNNWRDQSSEQKIGTANVNQLTTKWTFTAAGDVSATPTVADGALYFPDWGGNLNAVDRNTGAVLWTRQISEYNGHPGSIS